VLGEEEEGDMEEEEDKGEEEEVSFIKY